MTTKKALSWLTAHEFAHRGLHSKGVPENSIKAFQAAIPLGLGIECDIQRSCDDIAVVLHDWDLLRLTGVDARVENCLSADLERLSLLGTDQTLVPLSRAVDMVEGRTPLLLEIKSRPGYDVEKSCKCVLEAMAAYSGDFAIMSFDPRVARYIGRQAPKVICGLVIREDEHGHTQTQPEREAAFSKAQPDFLAYHVHALPNPWVAKLRERGVPILTWTVDSPAARLRAMDYADTLISEGRGLA